MGKLFIISLLFLSFIGLSYGASASVTVVNNINTIPDDSNHYCLFLMTNGEGYGPINIGNHETKEIKLNKGNSIQFLMVGLHAVDCVLLPNVITPLDPSCTQLTPNSTFTISGQLVKNIHPGPTPIPFYHFENVQCQTTQ